MNVSEVSLLKMWKDTVQKKKDIRAAFKTGKLILHNHSNTGVIFSPDLVKCTSQHSPFVGSGPRYDISPPNWKYNHMSDHWYSGIYSVALDVSNQLEHQFIMLDLYPWRSRAIHEAMTFTNSTVQTTSTK